MASLCYLLLFLLLSNAGGQDEGDEACRVRDKDPILIEPTADFEIGVVVNGHEAGQGLYGCGSPSSSGVTAFEAIRSALQAINRRPMNTENSEGKIALPGITLGLRVYDACGHSRTSVEQMTAMFPSLKGLPGNCDMTASNSLLGVIDLTAASSQVDVSEALVERKVPFLTVPTDYTSWAPPDRVAQIILDAIQTMEWEKMIVFHGMDTSSLGVINHLKFRRNLSELCVAHWIPLAEKTSDSLMTKTLLTTLSETSGDNTAILVVGHGTRVSLLLQTMAESPSVASKFQWLFASVPEAKYLLEIRNILSSTRVFALSPYPGSSSVFESRWSQLSMSLDEGRDDLYSEYRSTFASNPTSFGTISGLDVLRRTSISLPIEEALETFVVILQRAWNGLCGGRPGACPEMKSMGTRMFSEGKFFARPDSPTLSLALTHYSADELKVGFNQVAVYDTEMTRILDASFQYMPAKCPTGGCTQCSETEPLNTAGANHILKKEDPTEGESDLKIPLLVSIHKPGSSPLHCSSEIDQSAIQNIEAALYTLDHINSDTTFLPGVRLGLKVIDVCSSPLKTVQSLTELLSDDSKRNLAVVSALGPRETSIAATVLSSSNLTLISTADHSIDSKQSPYVLQVPGSTTARVRAIVELIKTLQWNYVSILHGDGYDEELATLKSGLASASICVAYEAHCSGENMEETAEVAGKLRDARDRGARGVVLLTDGMVLRGLLSVVDGKEFVWLASGEWTHDLTLVKGLETTARGALLFTPSQSNVPEFTNKFRQLRPETNLRNPFFADLWKQNVECDSCTGELNYRADVNVGHVMQAFLSVAAGLARARNEMCGQTGLCSRLTAEPQIRQVFNHYLRYTASVRPDGGSEMFSFNKDGYGESPIDLLNFRRATGGSYAYQKVASYKNHWTNLQLIVAYDKDGREVTLDKLPSKCTSQCTSCSKSKRETLLVPSPDGLYLAASFNIHESSSHPLQCNAKVSPTEIRRLEAFLWALGKANDDILRHNITLGALVFDSCSSPSKTAQDISNFLSSKSDEPDSQTLDGTLAILTTAASRDQLRPILDLSVPLSFPTMSLTSTGLSIEDNPTHLLRYSLPDEAWVQASVSLLKHFHWSYVSVIRSPQSTFNSKLFESMKTAFEKSYIKLAVVEDMPGRENTGHYSVEQLLSSLSRKQKEGARVVILLTTADDTDALLSTAQRLQKRGQFEPDNFLFVTYDNLKVMQKYPEQAVGALAVRPALHQEIIFSQYFSKLTPGDSLRNPWFKQYWDQERVCQGAACIQRSTYISKGLNQPDPVVTNVIQSVLSIATAASSVWRQQCASQKSQCLMSAESKAQFRESVFQKTKDVVLIRPDGSETAFGDKNYVKGKLEILNFKRIGSHALAYVTVGDYSEDGGLALNSSAVKTYNSRSQELSVADLISRCMDAKACGRQPKSTKPSLMYVNQNEKMFLGALMPIHNAGDSLFTCGTMNSKKMFHNMLALVYSLARSNSEPGSMASPIGAVIFDDCNQEQRAEQKVFSFFADQTDSTPNLISMISYNDEISSKVQPMLESKKVPLIIHPNPSRRPRSIPSSLASTIRTSPSVKSQMEAVVTILLSHGWRYVYVIQSENDFGMEAGMHFSNSAKQKDICIAEKVSFKPEATIQNLGLQLKRSFADPQPRVVVLITDDPFATRLVLRAAKEVSLLSRFVWIGTEGWGLDKRAAEILESSNVEAISLAEINPPMPGIQEFYSNLTLVQHDPIPDDWFEEYWQHRFECRLTGSTQPQLQYPERCTRSEKLNPKDMITKDIYATVVTVKSISDTMEEWAIKRCPDINVRGECGMPPEKELVEGVRRKLMDVTNNHGYDIYHLGNSSQGAYSYLKVGTWKEGSSDILAQFMVDVPSSVCRGSCSKCTEQMAQALEQVLPEQGPIYANFQTIWGIVATALSVLGIVLVIICTFYFLMAFPVTVGTTVLGYKILFGLMVLYAVNFAFILSPTDSTCGVRRFVMGLAYSIVFAGLLIKVMNTWRLMGYSRNDPNRMSSPAGLLVVSVGLVVVQVMLAAAWLVLMPPKTGFYQNAWRCAPPNSFEDELILSLVYVMLILAVTILFSILTWKCKENGQESRWILACCVFVALMWLVWTVLSTQLPLQYRDATIVIANLLCATLVMLCLYMRKVYVYSKLSREMKSKDLKSHLKGPHSYQHSMYGTLQKNLSAVAPVLCGSQASLTGKPFYRGHFGHVELDETQSETCGSTSSAGLVQVQGTDLYPLDVYDGGSHLSLYGPSKGILAINENMPYDR